MSDNEYAELQLAKLRARIENAAHQAGRSPTEITLIGAAKQQHSDTLANFIQAGLTDIGENYLQEALVAKAYLANAKVNWHYIGQIQSNKTVNIAANFNWVHSVDRIKIARRLAAHATNPKSLNILLQINIDDEPSKAGTAITEVQELVQKISALETINLRGFMVLPKFTGNIDAQRGAFAKTREALEQCNQNLGLSMDTLSMGMSGDLEAAILEGSTMIRVGTDLFGPRPA